MEVQVPVRYVGDEAMKHTRDGWTIDRGLSQLIIDPKARKDPEVLITCYKDGDE